MSFQSSAGVVGGTDGWFRRTSMVTRESIWVAGGALVAGLAALAFALLASRSLGLERFAPIAQMWTVWSISAATITFSIQQVAANAYHRGDERPGRGAMVPAVALAGLVALLTRLLRSELFYSDSAWWTIACTVLPLGSYLTGLARGRLAAQGSAPRLAIVVGGENAVRALLAVVLVLAGAGTEWFAIAVLAGFVVAGAGRAAAGSSQSTAISYRSARTAWAGSLAGLSAHSLLVLAPPLLAVAGSSRGVVSGVFLLLALYRAPYQLLLGVAPHLASRFSQASLSRGEEAPQTRLLQLAVASGGLAALAAVVAMLAGEPWLTSLIGGEGHLSRVDHGLAAALTLLISGAVVATMMLLATGAHRMVLAAWLVPGSIALPMMGIGWVHGVTPVLATLVLAAASILGLLAIGPSAMQRRAEARRPVGSQ